MSAAKTKLLPGYETTFITKNEMPDAALKTLKDKMIGIIGQFGGKVVTNDDWGKKRLAYPIQKETRGQYTYMVYTGKNGVVAEMERNLRLNDSTLRFMTIQLDSEFDEEVFVQKTAEAAAKRLEREKERERERESRDLER